VTLPRNVTLYRDSVDGTCDCVTYQKLVAGLFVALSVFRPCIRDDMVMT
jgi:hypothetical protein